MWAILVAEPPNTRLSLRLASTGHYETCGLQEIHQVLHLSSSKILEMQKMRAELWTEHGCVVRESGLKCRTDVLVEVVDDEVLHRQIGQDRLVAVTRAAAAARAPAAFAAASVDPCRGKGDKCWGQRSSSFHTITIANCCVGLQVEEVAKRGTLILLFTHKLALFVLVISVRRP